SEKAYGFVDNTMFLFTAPSLPEAHCILADMMHHSSGSFDWSASHNSPFELRKLALMNFPQSHRNIIPPDLTLKCTNLDGSTIVQTVCTNLTYKYLGVVFDSKLRWNAHHNKVVKHATW
ncbi:hypothetical protein C0991_001982, partial [Blastosporella zonata]